jgi:hypothetical protein
LPTLLKKKPQEQTATCGKYNNMFKELNRNNSNNYTSRLHTRLVRGVGLRACDSPPGSQLCCSAGGFKYKTISVFASLRETALLLRRGLQRHVLLGAFPRVRSFAAPPGAANTTPLASLRLCARQLRCSAGGCKYKTISVFASLRETALLLRRRLQKHVRLCDAPSR